MVAPTRRGFFAVAALAGFGTAAAGGCSRTATTADEQIVHGRHGITDDTAGLTPDQALAKLVEGNARFVAMTEVEPNLSTTRLMAIAKGQQPFVGVLGCVDSRVPPELVFDRGLGDVFDARIAGAIADDAAIGSLEFGVEEFGVPLLVVLGHSKCGAVTATVDALRSGDRTPPGRIGAIGQLQEQLLGAVVGPIVPAVRTVQAQGVTGDAVVNAAAREVVRRGVASLAGSPVLGQRLASGRLKIAGAFYDLDTGRVEFLT